MCEDRHVAQGDTYLDSAPTSILAIPLFLVEIVFAVITFLPLGGADHLRLASALPQTQPPERFLTLVRACLVSFSCSTP